LLRWDSDWPAECFIRYCFSSGVVVGQPSRVEDWTAGRKSCGAARAGLWSRKGPKPIPQVRHCATLGLMRAPLERNRHVPKQAGTMCEIGINQLEHIPSILKTYQDMHSAVSNIHALFIQQLYQTVSCSCNSVSTVPAARQMPFCSTLCHPPPNKPPAHPHSQGNSHEVWNLTEPEES
jgi:hypothetical protein